MESALPASLTGSGSYGGSLGGVKANAMGLDAMGSPTKKTKNNKPIKFFKRVEQNNEHLQWEKVAVRCVCTALQIMWRNVAV